MKTPRALFRSIQGASLLEVVVASSLIGGALWFGLSVFRQLEAEKRRDTGGEAGFQIEEMVRREVGRQLIAFHNGPSCTMVTFKQTFNGASASGLKYSFLMATETGALRDLNSKDPSASFFNEGLNRCGRSPVNPPADNQYFVNTAGIYFCLKIEAGAGWPTSADDMVTTMQPVFGEFFFTRVDATRPNTTELKCASPGGQSVSVLHYLIYWSPTTQQGPIHKRAGGMIFL